VFATIPTVTSRDEFWEAKKNPVKKPITYEDIWLPKSSGAGFIIGMFALAFGIAVVWHIWWLLIIGFIGAVVALIIRLTNDETEYYIPATEVAEHELKLTKDAL